MKTLQVGSKSIHVSSYIKALREYTPHTADLLVEEPCNFDGVENEIVLSFRSKNPITLLKNYNTLKAIIANICPELIHIHQVNRLGYLVVRAAKALKIPVITTAWGSDVLLIPKQNKFYRYLVKQTLFHSKMVTADAQEMITSMQKLVPSNKYHLLQYGIDLIEPKQKEKWIYSNRLHKNFYRIDKIIDYFNDFNKQVPDWKLIIAATGEETDKLKQRVQDYQITDKVEFAGWTDKSTNADFYARSSIYISIPESDGTSVSLLEAMSAGCIPIVPNISVSHEWIKNKENGIIETSGSNPILEALTIDQQKCVEYNQNLVAKKASRENCLAVFHQLYQQVNHA